MKHLQNSILFKWLCALLSCLFFGASITIAAAVVMEEERLEINRSSYSTATFGEDYLAASFYGSDYLNYAVEQYLYDQKKLAGEKVNMTEKNTYQNAMEHLREENTNFRYRILDLEGKQLYSNLAGEEKLESVCSRRYFSAISEERGLFFPVGYLQAMSTKLGDFGDYLDQFFVQVEGEYVSASDWENYQHALDEYKNWKQYEVSSNEGSASDEEEDDATASENWMEEPKDDCSRLQAVVEWGIADTVMDGTSTINDAFQQVYLAHCTFNTYLPWNVGLAAASAALCLLFFGLLLWAVGHKKEVEGCYLSPVHKLPADVLLFVLGGASVGVVLLGVLGAEWCFQQYYWGMNIGDGLWERMTGQSIVLAEVIFLTGFVAELVALPFFTTITAQLKTHTFRRSLLISICLGQLGRFFRWWGRLLHVLLTGLGSHLVVPGIYLVFHLMLGVLTLQGRYDGGCMVLAMLLVLLGFAALCWWLYGWKRACDGARHLAAGELHHQTGTEYTFGDMKQHLQNLNAISHGMQKAVEEQLKSDRFRTELITNVSHDLKTPLTSIISYVDLLKKREIPDETAQEYIAVLDQKSQRLKILTEDLVEASKAATGVLKVDAQRLDAGQLVHQAVGEYQERLEGAGLAIVMQIPDAPMYVWADGRHLWRILDNLLNNCVKYAMPGTRIYITVEQKGEKVHLSVKNISAEPLNIPAEELMERFVRGDSSRTNEGSGLGLSIAQSLAVLQGADFSVTADGDLFKAELEMKLQA